MKVQPLNAGSQDKVCAYFVKDLHKMAGKFACLGSRNHQKGGWLFNGSFKNANDLKTALVELSESSYADLIRQETPKILLIFENVFNHKAFTGRSGTFYGYEGLGSIYWHMVSKLQLAVLETCTAAIDSDQNSDDIGSLLDR